VINTWTGDAQVEAADGEIWGLEGPDESVGIFGWAVWHQSCKDENADTVRGAEVSDDHVKAECECGAKIDIEREV